MTDRPAASPPGTAQRPAPAAAAPGAPAQSPAAAGAAAAAPVGVRAFARILGRSPSYVSALKRAGRLVLTDDGKRIHIDASITRINATASPDKAPVAERWQQHRDARDAADATGDTTDDTAPSRSGFSPTSEAGPANPYPADPTSSGSRYQDARAVKERYNALTAKAEYERLIGKLCDADAVARAGADIGATLRSQLDALADRLAPELAADADPDSVHRQITDAHHHLLRDISRLLQQAAQASEPQPQETANAA